MYQAVRKGPGDFGQLHQRGSSPKSPGVGAPGGRRSRDRSFRVIEKPKRSERDGSRRFQVIDLTGNRAASNHLCRVLSLSHGLARPRSTKTGERCEAWLCRSVESVSEEPKVQGKEFVIIGKAHRCPNCTFLSPRLLSQGISPVVKTSGKPSSKPASTGRKISVLFIGTIAELFDVHLSQ